MIEYFKLKWGISISQKDENQPLLIVNVRDEQIFLPPSLCYEASLPKDFTRDSRKMKALQDYKLSNPD